MKKDRSDSLKPKTIPSPDILTEAGRHWREGRKERAEALCHYMLGLIPGQPDALHLLSIMAHESGNINLAISYLRQACKSNTVNANYLSNFAEICRQCNLLDEGEKIGRRAVLKDPNNFGSWNNLGIILQQLGKFDESKDCLTRAIRIQPRNPILHNNIGNTYKYLGLNEKAEKHWLSALVLDPNYAEPHSNLAKLLAEKSEYNLAIQHGKKAIEIKPNLYDAYVNISEAYFLSQNYNLALVWIDKLLKIAPEYARGLIARSLVLVELEKFQEALEHATKAVSLAPHSAEAHNAHGIALKAVNEINSAALCFERASSLAGNSAKDALINLGLLFLENGETTKAQNVLKEALVKYPLSSVAWFHYANSKKFTIGDPEIKDIEKLIKSDYAKSDVDQQYLNFAIGKIYMDTEQHKLAMDHIHFGNNIKRKTFIYSSEKESAFIENLKHKFSRELIGNFQEKGARSKMPIFILGMPRSGTTLIEQILSSHSEIIGAGELNYIQNIFEDFSVFDKINSMTPNDLQNLGKTYLTKISLLSQGKTHVVDKMPGNFRYIGFIRLILPDAKIIHCRRDPIDTCLSCYTKLFAKGVYFSFNQQELGQAYYDYRNIMKHWRSVLTEKNFFEIDYENVVEDFEVQTRRILAFLDLDWEDSCLEFYQNKRPVRTASVNQVRLPIYRTSKGKWHRYADEIKPLLEALASIPPLEE